MITTTIRYPKLNTFLRWARWMHGGWDALEKAGRIFNAIAVKDNCGTICKAVPFILEWGQGHNISFRTRALVPSGRDNILEWVMIYP
ncbi:MAG: hypothetical protein AAFQ80_05820 [Cyanobacteria bacterium J06621_8]